ncbi:hypothetical protein Esi_0018_0105 [Ectocarpus siliculosus]|uniref:Uncharacterized protein n=1 Tax=Ectocarpus siliculosus TaxID=2880 RepID=D7FNL3_ECTSI|nr:hypothetical protein Esi_0018_0105 [Ectocarpus siliculosus]|eukprot:CBJ26024.1 hypothetical protein Esi_0018_0105 [Ectocarpus siliculosus]
MRPPPKRAGGRQSRGPALTSVLPVPDGSRRAAPSTGMPPDERLDSPPGSANGPGHGKVETSAGAAVEGEPRPESDRHRLSSQAAVSPAAPEASAADELQRQARHFSSEGCVFRVGDTVLARTAGRPAREATVVEADPSDGSRFKVAFKDKRKKGGWRDKNELSSLPRPADAGSAATAMVPLPSSSAAAAGEARPAPPQQRRDDRNAEVDAAAAAATAPEPSLAADSERTSGKQQPPCSEVVAAESPGALAAAVSDEAQRQGHLPSGGCLFQVGDAVLVNTAGKAAASSSEATVVEVDPPGGSRFKVAFKDKRKKGGWRDKSELSAVRHTGAGSTAAGQPPSEPASGAACGTGGGGGGTVGAEPGAGLPRPGASDTRSSPACSSTAVEAEPMPQSDRQPSPTAVVGTHESSEPAAPVPAPASPSGPLFGVGEAVLVSTAGKTAATASFEATVVEVDPSDSSRFRVAFKNKRKQGGWRHRSELSALMRRTGARSTATRPASGSVGNAGPTSGSSASHEKSRAGMLGQGGRASEAPALGAASEARARAKGPPGQGLQRSASQGERPVDKVGNRKTAAPAMDTTAVRESGGISGPPKRKRSAATAAAAAITATAGNRGRGGSRSSGGGGVQAIKKKPVKKGGQAKRGSVAAAGGTAAGITKKTPRKKGWQRPTVVTPGSVEGRPESALRTTHPTEIIRPRKQFKVQQARVTPKARAGSSNPSSRGAAAPRSSFSAGRGGSASAPRRMLCQPSHSVRDAKRGGFEGGDGGDRSSGVGGGAGADDESDVVRRGRRARRQVHPSLSEDTMAAANGGIESDYRSDEDGEGAGAGGGYGDAPFRFRTSEVAPWGEGDRPLIKVRLSLLEGDAPLSAERSALAVVTFVFDRHRYSAEQLANVLTAEGFLCYRDEDKRVFVLTESKEADQKEALRRVRELALSRCGVEVKATPWLEGRPALDEFLDNHRGVLDLIIRHRLACGMWSEVGGVYFNALFCGRRSKRTFNGVRLQINLAVSHNRALETGVWELWMTVEPVVHRFSPVDWWALMQEKEDKGLADFSGSKSDDLEERLQVVCLPKLTRGVVDDVKEDAFEMDLLQEANLKRGYYVGPRSEDEMVEYWRQVHHLALPSSSFAFVKVRIGGMVLTYPSWCVIRGQREIPEATKAMRGRILDSFTDALDGMQGVHVMQTTFTWQVQGEGGGRTFGDAPAFATANGTAVAVQKTGAAAPAVTPGPASGDGDGPAAAAARGYSDDGSVGGGSGKATQAAAGLRTPGPSAAGVGGGAADSSGLDDDQRRGSAPVVVTPPADPNASTPPPPLLVCRLGEQQQQSPESRAAAAAAQASVAAVRKSVVRRRGAVVPKRVPSLPTATAAAAAAGAAGGAGAAGESSSAPRLCSAPFVIKRKTASPSSAVAAAAGVVTPAAGAGEAPPPPPPASSEGAGLKKKRKDKSSRREGGAASVDKERRKKSKKGTGVSAAAAAARAAVGAGAGVGAGEELRRASPVGHTPAAAPPMVVTFAAAGSLGMGLEADTTEEGTMRLAGKAPTSAAAAVPNGWRLTAVGGKSVRRLGDEKIAALLMIRPVEVTFEQVPRAEIEAKATPPPPAPAPAAPRKRAAPAKSKAAAAAATAGAKPKAGTKAKAPAGRSKGKKASKVTTVRKAFKIQARAPPQQEGRGGETGGGGGGHAVPMAVQASSTSAAI